MLTVVPWRPLLAATLLVTIGALAAWSGSLVTPVAVLGGLLGYATGAVLIAARWRRPGFGVANLVTLIRVVGTCWVLGLTVGAVAAGPTPAGLTTAGLTPAAQTLLVAIGTGCLLLDGLDGHLARRRGECSDFGARFDMETDAALLLVLSVAVAVTGAAGWWVLLIGGMRYLYVAAAWRLPALRTPLPYRYSRKVVAVVQGVALLLALTLPRLGAPALAVDLTLVAALSALGWSFGRDVLGQLRGR